LFGALYEFTHWNNYGRDPEHKGTLWAQAWRHAIMEGMLNCYQFRIHDGFPEFSSDGGVTWSPVTAINDGQSGHSPQTDEPLKPARTGENKRCLAAANATACFVELHREICDWWDNAAIVLIFCGAISAVLGLFFPIAWQSFAMTVNYMTIINNILNYTDALTPESFTTAIQERLTCILYSLAADNGQWSESAFADVLTTVRAESGSMWRLIEIYLEQIGGYIALNNAGTTTSVATYDCSTCGYCYEFDFRLGSFGWLADSTNNPVVYTAGQGFVGSNANYNNVFAIAHFELSETASGIVGAWVTMVGAGNRSGALLYGVLCWDDAGGSNGQKQGTDGNSPGPATVVLSEVSGNINNAFIRAQAGGPGEEFQTGTITLQSVHIYSNEAIPDFAGFEC
jgi:hypothetical protein